MKKKVLVILGPTASGKSDLAVRLAKKFNGEIISADSRQVYKGLNIGTGKITKKEMRGVPHYMLDVADPKKYFSVSEYKKLAERNLSYIVSEQKLPIVVGGTGLYIDVLTGAMTIPDVGPNPLLRKKLEKKSVEELFKILTQIDPRRAKIIDQHNKVRLIRAIEIVRAIGKVPLLTPSVNKKFIYIGLKPNNLNEKIYGRLIKRLPGIIREAKKLHAQGLTYKRIHELGLEYRYAALYLQGKTSQEKMVEKLYTEIKHYAKRQMTWFKRNKKIKWFGSDEYKKIENHIKKALS